VGWLHCTLSHIVRNQEEVELSINYFRLLNKTLINIGSGRRVENLSLGLFEESLSYSLVDNDQSDLWSSLVISSL
jgi:hypothetical protein